MKKIDLLLLLNKVDEKYLAEAEERTSKVVKDDEEEIIVTGVDIAKKPYKRKRAASIAAAAASLCILSGVTIGLANSPFLEPSNSLSENVDSSEANNTEHEQLQTQQITEESSELSSTESSEDASEPSSTEVTENASESSSIEVTDDAAKPLEIPYSEVPETAKLGERFCVIPPVDGGHLYVTLNKCEVFDSLNDAGIEYDELMNIYVINGFNYNEETTEFIDGFKMIKIHMTIENVDAISHKPKYDPDSYGDYDFSMESIGSVEYATGEYFNLHQDKKGKQHYFTLHIEPGEKKDIVIGYLIDTNRCALEDAVFKNGYATSSPDEKLQVFEYTKVDLELEG